MLLMQIDPNAKHLIFDLVDYKSLQYLTQERLYLILPKSYFKDYFLDRFSARTSVIAFLISRSTSSTGTFLNDSRILSKALNRSLRCSSSLVKRFISLAEITAATGMPLFSTTTR